MGRRDQGISRALQDIKLSGMGTATLSEAVESATADILAGADFEGSALDELCSIVHTAYDDLGFKPNGYHLVGRDVETELMAGRESLVAIRDDIEGHDAALRAAVVPEIARIETRITAGEHLKALRDPDWGADIVELIARIAPHPILVLDRDTGLYIVQMQTLKIETLSVEIDDYGEICVWKYSEPPVLES